VTFRNRKDAGRQLSTLLAPFATEPFVVVGIPPGGVLVAAEVARALRAPLFSVLARRICAPGGAVGSVAEQGVLCIDAMRLRSSGLSRQDLEAAAHRATLQLARQMAAHRPMHPLPQVAGRTVLLIDDGVVTGNTARAAAHALRELRARRIVLAAPVISEVVSASLRDDADAIVCAVEPPGEHLILSDWYEDGFPDVDEAEASEAMRGETAPRASAKP
jgi:putative phosphoribosyl transferase